MIPVYLITGALGSGKTSFLRQILARQLLHGESAVIVNDFGDLMFDQLKTADTEGEIIEMPGGCICCSAADEFRGVVRKVLARKPERLFVEASGIAETRPFRDDLYLMGLTAQATICIVDCANHAQLRAALPSVDEQVQAADIFLLSKTDLVSSQAKTSLQAELRHHKPQAIQYEVRDGYLESDALQVLFGTRGDFLPGAENHPRLFEHDVTSFIITFSQAADAGELAAFLDDLPSAIVRLKGHLRICGEGDRFVKEHNQPVSPFHINSVCGRWEAIELTSDTWEHPGGGELLLICLDQPSINPQNHIGLQTKRSSGVIDEVEETLRRGLKNLPGTTLQCGILQRLRQEFTSEHESKKQ